MTEEKTVHGTRAKAFAVAGVLGVTGVAVGVLGALALGGPALGLGSSSSNASHSAATSKPFAIAPSEAVVSDPPYPKNELGMTYGSGLTEGDNPGPDLIAAYGVGGVFGYVRATDLPQPAANPSEALAEQQDQLDRSIPLYAQDGVTIVGTYVSHPGVSGDASHSSE